MATGNATFPPATKYALSSTENIAGNVRCHVERKSEGHMVCHVPILHFSYRRKCNFWSSACRAEINARGAGYARGYNNLSGHIYMEKTTFL